MEPSLLGIEKDVPREFPVCPPFSLGPACHLLPRSLQHPLPRASWPCYPHCILSSVFKALQRKVHAPSPARSAPNLLAPGPPQPCSEP